MSGLPPTLWTATLRIKGSRGSFAITHSVFAKPSILLRMAQLTRSSRPIMYRATIYMNDISDILHFNKALLSWKLLDCLRHCKCCVYAWCMCGGPVPVVSLLFTK
ncbi:hypothetical protein SERLADRAFT_455801 [Serpula lacrymans var. lacrymans S7.9]|uniref:Uncharacterized protein n=1 Tax=Serpula lacrymans var. lacrymans (strain S7.9) TaxID=578457 RepID=F8NEW4_SERL9|nr:uncharacterized protein SERLADRAFT_455801 [Serpula lacrymans var. lacrymans S7.9]EGO31112.1 hypothetical protein SERLADRAFT_455801 [Serpula lacrymans var. lacrymans S7.9]